MEGKKLFFVFFFPNSKLLHNEQLHDYSRKSKKTIFLNNICLTCNFAELINIRRRRFAPKLPYYVPLEDFQRVFSRAPKLWWKALLALAYTSGGRRDELLNLTWSDIDFETQTVRFVPKRSSEVILAWEPKDHQIREVPIPSETLQLLVNLQFETLR